jgi:hypothetical protein
MDQSLLCGGGGFMSPPRTWYAVVAYCAIVGAIIAIRPAVAFMPDGTPRQFGTGPGQSLLSLGTLTSGAAILSGAVFATADAVAG